MAAGRLGQKTGKGNYDYGDDGRTPIPSEQVGRCATRSRPNSASRSASTPKKKSSALPAARDQRSREDRRRGHRRPAERCRRAVDLRLRLPGCQGWARVHRGRQMGYEKVRDGCSRSRRRTEIRRDVLDAVARPGKALAKIKGTANMREAAIVSHRPYADRQGLHGRIQRPRGANDGRAARSAKPWSARGVDPGEIDDCVMGCAMQQGTQTFNIGRLAAHGGRAARSPSAA